MSKSIDERVVELRFDNKQFESGASQSMSTLDKLKSKLNFKGAEESFNKLDKASSSLKFTVLSNGVEAVHAKFSALEIAGITALQRITNQAIDTGERLVKSLSVDQISTGFDKYNTITANVQTLVNSTGKSMDEIYGYLEKLNWYSDETSYGLTDMTSALSEMSASGGDIDKLIPMIIGVANATAFAGKSAQDFKYALQFGINQAYGLGYLGTQDWKSITRIDSKQLRQAIIDAGELLGTIEKGSVTVETFKNTLKDQWVTTEVMEKAFSQFATTTDAIWEGYKSGEFKDYKTGLEQLGNTYGVLSARAAASAQEAKTFQEAVDATKDAVSSGWLNTFQTIFGNYNEAKRLWSDTTDPLWRIFAGGSEARNEALAEAFDSSWAKIKNKIRNAGIDLDDFSEKFLNSYKYLGQDSEERAAVQKILEEIEYGTKTLDDLFEADKTGAGTAHAIVTVLQEYADTVQVAAGSTDDMSDRLAYFQNVVDRVWSGEFKNAPERFQLLAEAGYEYAEVQRLVDLTESGRKLTLEDLNEQELEAIGYTKEQVAAIKDLADEESDAGAELKGLLDELGKASGRELLRDSIITTLESVAETVGAIRNAIADAIGLDYNSIYRFLEKIRDFAESLKPTEDGLASISNLVGGLVSLLKSLGRLLTGAVRFGFEIVSTVLERFGVSLGGIADTAGDAFHGISDFLDSIDPFGAALDFLKPKIIAVTDWFVKLFEAIKNSSIVSNITKRINEEVGKLRKGIDGIDLGDSGTSFGDRLKAVFNIAKNAVLDFKDNSIAYLTAFRDKALEIIKSFSLKNIVDEFTKGKDSVVDFVSGASDSAGQLPGVLDSIKSLFSNFINGAGTIAEDTGVVFGGMWQNIRDAIDDGFGSKLLIGGSLVASLLGITNAVKGIAYAAKSLANPIDVFANTLTKVLKPITNSIDIVSKASMIRAVAFAILSIAGTFYLLSQIDYTKLKNINNILNQFLVMIAVIFAVVSTSSILSQIAGKANVFVSSAANLTSANIGKQMFQVALSFIGIAAAFKIFETINPDSIGRTTGIMFLTLGGVAAMITIVNLLSKGIVSGGPGLSTAIGNAGAKIPLIGKVFKMMGYGGKGDTSNAKKNVDSAGSQLLKIALGVVAMTIALRMVAKMDEKAVNSGLSTLAKIAAGILAFTFIASIIPNAEVKGIGEMFGGIAKALIAMTIAIGILAIIPGGKLAKAVVGFAAIMSVVTIFTAVTELMSGLGNAGTVKQLGDMFKGLGAAFITMSIAIAILASIDSDNYWRAVGTVAGMLILVGAIEVLVSRFGKKLGKDQKQQGLGGSAIMSIAGAILTLSIALIALSFLNPDELLRTTVAIGSLLLEVGAIIVLTSIFGKESKGSTGSIIALDVAIGLLLGMLLLIAKIAKPEELEAASKAIAISMGALGVLIYGLKAGKSPNFGTNIATLLMATILIGALGLIMDLVLDSFDENDLNKVPAVAAALGVAIAGVAIIMLAVAGVTKIIGNGKFNKDTNAIAGWGSTIVGIVGGIIVLCAILPLIGEALQATSGAELSEMGVFAGVVGTMILAIVAIAAAMSALIKFNITDDGSWNQKNILQAAELMGLAAAVVVAATALFGAALRAFKDEHLNDDKISAIASMMATLIIPTIAVGTVMAIIVKYLGDIDFGAVLKVAGILLVAVAVIDIVILAYAGLAKLLDYWGLNDRATVKKTTNIISDIIVAIFTIGARIQAGVLDILGNAVLRLLNGFCDFIERAADACGYFIEKFKNVDDNTQRTIALVVDAIGLIIAGTFVSTIVNFITGGLGTLGMIGFLGDMALVADGLILFVNKLKGNITPEDAELAASAGSTIKALSESVENIKTDALTKFWNWMTGSSTDLATFGSDLTSLADGVIDFSNVFKEKKVTKDDVEVAVEATKVLASLNDIVPKTGGFFQLFTGEEDIGKFGEDIGKLGKGLAQFSSFVGYGGIDSDVAHLKDTTLQLSTFQRFDQDAFDKGVAAIKTIAETNFPDTGWFGAENDLKQFGLNLSGLGSGLRDFETSVSDISDWDRIDKAVSAIGTLATSTTFVQGDNSDITSVISDIALELIPLANGLDALWDAVSTVSDTQFVEDDAGVTQFEHKIKIASHMCKVLNESMADLATVEVAENSIFSNNLVTKNYLSAVENYGDLLKTIYTTLATTSTIGNFNGSEAEARRAINSGAVSLLDLFSDPNSPTVIAIEESAYAMGEIAKALTVASAIDPNAVQNFADSFNQLAHISIVEFSAGIGSDENATLIKNAVDNAVTDWGSYILNPMTTNSPLYYFQDVFRGLGRKSINTLGDDILDKYESNKQIGLVIEKLKKQLQASIAPSGAWTLAVQALSLSTVSTFLSGITSTFAAYEHGNVPSGEYDYYAMMVEHGRNFMRGFNEGVTDAKILKETVEAMGDIATLTIDTLMITYDMHSPSKVTEKIGKFFSQGLINGILSKSDLLKGAVEKLAGDGSDGISSAVSKVLDLINNGVDSDVTITPVLNLDEVTSGIGDLNGMLDGAFGQIDMNGFINSASLDTLNGFDVNGLDYNINEYLYNQNGADVVGSGDTIVNYTQNNYSPKSLSNLDIYRNTKTQLSSLKKGLALNA